MDIDSAIASVDSKTLASATVFTIVQTASSESFEIVEQSFDLGDLSGQVPSLSSRTLLHVACRAPLIWR
jgi:hypothetical protein